MNERYSKMYIAVLDEAPDYMVPTLVAHSVLTAHAKFQGEFVYMQWFKAFFRKVTVRVNRREFDKIRTTLVCHQGHENTICNGEPSCLVVMPVWCDEIPKVLQYAKLWKPNTGD